MKPLILLRVGYMDRYDGTGTITSGGAYVEARGVGGEMLNFSPSQGRCYGYATSRHSAGINLAFLDSSNEWKVGDELNDVDVVFFARRPQGGQVIVGWYQGATVFHKQYRVRRGVSIAGMDEAEAGYLCVVDAARAVLLPGSKRTFAVPYAPAAGKGFSGESNVWYPDKQTEPDVVRYVKQVRLYISRARGLRPKNGSDGNKTGNKGGGRTRTPDHAMNALVEIAAVKAAAAYYRAKGYSVRSVERENLGWDIVVTKAKSKLLVEVKGVSAPSIRFELTPNEYAKLKEYSATFRVCVVCNAITQPRVFEFTPHAKASIWQLLSKADGAVVQLIEKIGAVAVEITQDAN